MASQADGPDRGRVHGGKGMSGQRGNLWEWFTAVLVLAAIALAVAESVLLFLVID